MGKVLHLALLHLWAETERQMGRKVSVRIAVIHIPHHKHIHTSSLGRSSHSELEC